MSNEISTQQTNNMEESGERLGHILDQIGFRLGRGRIDDFHKFLVDKRPDLFGELKYTTVRSWFHNSAPPMVRVVAVIDALETEYRIQYDLSQIKTWWKVGGFYPFVNSSNNVTTPTTSNNQICDQKLQFKIMALVTEEVADEFDALSGDQLIKIKEKAIQLANDFSNPSLVECPSEYIRMIIRDTVSLTKKI